MKRLLSRRNVLRGAGVMLALPWMESLVPKAARAQATAFPKRFMPIFLPNGASEMWLPPSTGVGAAWQLSSVLEPLAALKAKLSILTNMENGSAFNVGGGSSVEPSHGRQPGRIELFGHEVGVMDADAKPERSHLRSIEDPLVYRIEDPTSPDVIARQHVLEL